MEDINAIKFIEWVVELLPPEYDLDTRRRFTPQIPSSKNSELLWTETHKYNYINPKFYTTKELYEIWLDNIKNNN